MVKKNELKIGNQYYVPCYGGATKITLLSVNGKYAEVEAKEGQVFHRNLQFLFTDSKAANRSRRTWEHGVRKAKRRH